MDGEGLTEGNYISAIFISILLMLPGFAMGLLFPLMLCGDSDPKMSNCDEVGNTLRFLVFLFTLLVPPILSSIIIGRKKGGWGSIISLYGIQLIVLWILFILTMAFFVIGG